MLSIDAEVGPYAPPSNILTLVQRQRQSGLPEVLDTRLLLRLGMPEGNLPRIVQAMRFLHLIDEDGRQTDLFQRLRKTSTEEYPKALAEVLRSAYEPIFSIVDPATATDIQLADAFRHYSPSGQRTRMVTLFLGLCREAEIVEEGPVLRKSPPRKVTDAHRSTAAEKRKSDAGPKGGGHTPRNEASYQAEMSVTPNAPPQFALLHVLLSQLPGEGRWTQKRRDQWLQAITANVDLLVEVIEAEEQKEPQQKLPL